MKFNPVRYSSAVGEIWVMATFKVKYCHKIFNIADIRDACYSFFVEALDRYNIRYNKIRF